MNRLRSTTLSLAWGVGLVVLAADARSEVPPPPAVSCESPAPAHESHRARLTRKGWRQSRAPILNEGAWLTTATIAQGRHLGEYRIDQMLDPEMTMAYEGRTRYRDSYRKARDFLWRHWVARRPAYLMLTGQAIGAVTTTHIFVEAEDSGRWRVAWRIVRSNGVVDDLPMFYGVEWAPATIPGPETEGPADSGSGAGGRKVLRFLDHCGELGASL